MCPDLPRVVHAPGHTAGSCALFLEDRSLLFSGDALVTLDVVRGPRGRQGPQIARGPFAEDADLAMESLDVLAATNADTVLPGHGEPWPHGVKSAVEFARQEVASGRRLPCGHRARPGVVPRPSDDVLRVLDYCTVIEDEDRNEAFAG